MSLLNYLQIAYASLSSIISSVYAVIIKIIDINFKAVTVTIETCEDIVTAVIKGFLLLKMLLSNVISSAFDFVLEIFGLLHAFVLVLWKFLVFLGSVCYSMYQCIEILFYFIATNSVWLFRIISDNAISGKDVFIKVFRFITDYTVWGVQQIFAGIGAIGTAGIDGISTVFSSSKWMLRSLWNSIDNGMMAFAESVRFVTDTLYYGLLDLMCLKKDTYLGLLICLLVFLFIANVFKSLKQRGMTFPNINDNIDVRYPRVRPNFGFDFSDNEEDVSDVNNDTETEDSENTHDSSETDDEEVDEYEVDDMTTDDEISDSDSTPSIDIQLPPVNDNVRSTRRSTTPSRINIHSSEDFQKEIEREQEKIKCVVCQDNEKSVLILPCKHLCLCLPCGNTIARSRNVDRRVCPLCRKKIQTIMNVYT